MIVRLCDLKKTTLVLSPLAAMALIVAGCGRSGLPNGAGTPGVSPAPVPTAAPNISISSPSSRATVTSPFTLAANASSCSSQTVTSIGYALDSNTDIMVVNSASINVPVVAVAGSHTLIVDAWNGDGTKCSATVAITVAQPAPPKSNVPANAVTVANIQALSQWAGIHDSGTDGSSSGTTAMTNSPTLSGNARQFATSFSNSGGERYWVTFGNDPEAENFFYDTWIYISGSSATIANLEFDLNQVMANGQTVIFGFQCDGYSGTWDYAENAGTPSNPIARWGHANAACNPRSWRPDAWHHLQIGYARNSEGNVTYQSVWLDGVESPINVTVPSSFALGWAQVLLTNFQVDGLGTGSNTVYLDNLTILRW